MFANAEASRNRCVCAQVQQQAALMASVGQGGYLSPMAAFAAAQMQHMATINGLPGAPLTPTSGKERRRTTRRVWCLR